jgi:beta-barrel assembly-enhancing protease
VEDDIALGQQIDNEIISHPHEYESDEYPVKYLYPTEYDAAAIGSFFEKIMNEPTPPAFLSDHPSPEDRLAKITEVFNSLGGVHGQLFPERYQQFKSTLT